MSDEYPETCEMCDEPCEVLVHIVLLTSSPPVSLWVCYADFDVMRDRAKEPALHADAV